MPSDDKGRRTFTAQIQEFQPKDIARLIETAPNEGPGSLDAIGQMAADTIKHWKTMPPSAARDAQIAGALDTIQRVVAEKERRRL